MSTVYFCINLRQPTTTLVAVANVRHCRFIFEELKSEWGGLGSWKYAKLMADSLAVYYALDYLRFARVSYILVNKAKERAVVVATMPHRPASNPNESGTLRSYARCLYDIPQATRCPFSQTADRENAVAKPPHQ